MRAKGLSTAKVWHACQRSINLVDQGSVSVPSSGYGQSSPQALRAAAAHRRILLSRRQRAILSVGLPAHPFARSRLVLLLLRIRHSLQMRQVRRSRSQQAVKVFRCWNMLSCRIEGSVRMGWRGRTGFGVAAESRRIVTLWSSDLSLEGTRSLVGSWLGEWRVACSSEVCAINGLGSRPVADAGVGISFEMKLPRVEIVSLEPRCRELLTVSGRRVELDQSICHFTLEIQ